MKELEEALVFDIGIDPIINLQEKIDRYAYELEKINANLEFAQGKDKVALLKEQAIWLQKQADTYKEMQKVYIDNKNTQMKDLEKNGFKFNEYGYITNYEEALKKLENYVNASKTNVQRELREKEVEKVKESLEGYLENLDSLREANLS